MPKGANKMAEVGKVEERCGGKVLVERREDHVAAVIFNNPKKRNSIDLPMAQAMIGVLSDLEGEKARVLIVKGAEEGKAFCSGFDITSLPAGEGGPLAVTVDENPLVEFMRRLEAAPMITIAMLNGHAFGAGGETAVACDIRVGVRGGGLFGMPPARIGVLYHPEGLARFVNAVGLSRTKELFYTAKPISMERAAEVGLLHHLVEPGKLESFTDEMAGAIAANAPLSLAGTKKTLRAICPPPDLPPEVEAELRELRLKCFASRDMREGKLAFMEKRKPVFTGE